MIPAPDHRRNGDKLEHLIHRTLRDLPGRTAPRSLEQRVLAEIARRAALPWWRKSFTHWPVPARAAFLVLLIGVVKVVLMAAVWVMAGFDVAQFREAFATQFTWMEGGFAVVRAVTDFFGIMARNIPPLWLYGGLAFVATLYVTLFGLGAAAYKALYAQR
jgi:hypothetical protein